MNLPYPSVKCEHYTHADKTLLINHADKTALSD